MDRSQCEHFNSFIIPDICKVFDQTNQIWTEIMSHTQPKIKCPLKSTTFKITNATIDYSLIAHLPLDGYTWIIYLKVFKPIAKVRHRKRMMICILAEATIVTTKQETKRREQLSTQLPIKLN